MNTLSQARDTAFDASFHLAHVVRQIAQVRDLPALMAIVRRAARELTGADGATLVLRDNEQCFYADEDAIGPLWKGQRFPLSACVSGWAMLNARPAVIEDIYSDPRVPYEAYRPTFVKSLSMVPIGAIGAIGCYWARRHQPSSAEVTLQSALADATAVGITNIELYRQLDEARRVAEARALEAQINAALFRKTFEHAGAGIAHVSIDGRWLLVNQKLCDIVGYTREELLTLRFQDITHADDLGTDLELVRRLLTGEIPSYSIEKRYIHRHGHPIWTNLTVTLERDAAGTPDYFISLVEDISRRKTDEERLRQHAMVFDSSQEGVVITDTQACVLDTNAAFERITEYPLDEIRGRNMRHLQSGRHDRSFYLNMWESIATTGGWQGEIWNRRKHGEIYLEWINISAVKDEHGQVAGYVGTHIDISRMHHVQSEMERRALHDALTGLPNRLLLHSRLEHALERVRRGGHGAVLFLDLDRFKPVNDTLGHRAGDLLLQAVAVRIKQTLREIDTCARLGGDEFVVVLEELQDASGAAQLAQRVIGLLSEPFLLEDGRTVRIGCSIGIALFPEHGCTAEHLIERADHALYEAKRAGKGVYRFCESSSPG